MKLALLDAYFKDGKDVSDTDILIDVVTQLGLDGAFAKQLLTDQVYSGDVRALQEQWRQLGVTAVPTFVINEQYMMSGGQPTEAFVQGLRQIIET